MAQITYGGKPYQISDIKEKAGERFAEASDRVERLKVELDELGTHRDEPLNVALVRSPGGIVAEEFPLARRRDSNPDLRRRRSEHRHR